MRTILLSFIALLGAVQAWAYDAVVDGIYYDLNATALTATVTYKSYSDNTYHSDYSGVVTIPSSITYSDVTYNVTAIGYGAFYGSTGLTSIIIPSSVTSISFSLFSRCTALASIEVDADNTMYDSRNGCNAIIETASNTLVVGCKETEIPNTVTSIGSSAFEGCTGLTSIAIPESVTSIGAVAFSGCSNITSLVSKMKNPFEFNIITFKAFEDFLSSCVLTVPYGTTAAYEAAGWTTEVFGGGIVEAPQEDVTVSIGGADVATYCYDHDLDFSGVEGLTAYVVSGFNTSASTLTLAAVTEAPSGEGLLLAGD